MRKIYFVRHCEKAWSNGKKPAGLEGHHHDPPLAEKACLSAETLEQLQGIKFDHVFCSPFERTRQTCALITDQVPTCALELSEYLGNQRSWRYADVTVTTAGYFTGNKLNKLLREKMAQLERRVTDFLAALPVSGNILVVSHGLVIRKLCGVELKEGCVQVV